MSESSTHPYPLSASSIGRRVQITGIQASPAADRLQRLGVWTGDALRVTRMNRGGVLVVTDAGTEMLLPVALARNILVSNGSAALAWQESQSR